MKKMFVLLLAGALAATSLTASSSAKESDARPATAAAVPATAHIDGFDAPLYYKAPKVAYFDDEVYFPGATRPVTVLVARRAYQPPVPGIGGTQLDKLDVVDVMVKINRGLPNGTYDLAKDKGKIDASVVILNGGWGQVIFLREGTITVEQAADRSGMTATFNGVGWTGERPLRVTNADLKSSGPIGPPGRSSLEDILISHN